MTFSWELFENQGLRELKIQGGLEMLRKFSKILLILNL